MSATFKNNEFARPFNDLVKYVPQALRNEMNVSLLDNLFNRFMTHDESVPLYGYIGTKPTAPDDRILKIPQPSVEREVNTIVPVLSFMTGTNQHNFTVQDLIQRAKAIGVNDEGQGWLYSQSNNFVPPINLDKFTNFFRYYWVARALPTAPTLAWNSTLAPEYYTIAQPSPSDLKKINVRLATTRSVVLTGAGFDKIGFKLKFTSPTTAVLSYEGDLAGWTVTSPTTITLSSYDQPVHFKVARGTTSKTLLTFNITREMIYGQDGQVDGHASFEAGDEFSIAVTFLTRIYNVSFRGSPGVKGKLTKVRSLNEYQTIDGVQVQPGDRILVKSNSSFENGIYIVSAGDWERAADFKGATAKNGSSTWVTQGLANNNTMFVATTFGSGFTWTVDTSAKRSNTNDWQEGNFWYSSDDLDSMGISKSDAVQATRPIIEFDSTLKLNNFVDANDIPSDTGFNFEQRKTRFDQAPLFDLYRYDGTHSGLVSPVFYYEASQIDDLDPALQIRTDTVANGSNDFQFNHGMFDETTGALLFARDTSSGNLVSVWHTGYAEPTVVDTIHYGEGNGTLANLRIIDVTTPQQVWRIERMSATAFTVTGSVSVGAPDALIGVPYDNGQIAFTITEGSTPFGDVDSFAVRIGNLDHPVYAVPTETGTEVPYNGEASGKVGAYQISRTFINNPYSESRKTMSEGVLFSHFQSIMAAQPEGMKPNYAFGGDIKLWGEQQTLFASLLMQRDMTPISMVDMAERFYESALNNVRDIYMTSIAQYIGLTGSIKTQDAVEGLADWILDINAKGEDATRVLYDSTSPVKGFPITLPQMGAAPLVKPGAEFSAELGINVLIHHDGHMSPQEMDTFAFRTSVLGNFRDIKIERSDGEFTHAIGSFTSVAPANPYRGELWSRPDGTILSFGVQWDSQPVVSEIKEGDLWWNRFTRELQVMHLGNWIPSSANPWQPVNFANVYNRLVLTIENRLYEGINPNTKQIAWAPLEADPTFQGYIKDELYTFTALNNYDPTAIGYNPADPFTWNYSQVRKSQSAPVTGATVPARWFDYLKAHQKTVTGVIPTAQPHMEPWKLLGWSDANAWWASLTPAQQTRYTPVYQPQDLSELVNGGAAYAASSKLTNVLAGLIVVDGVTVRAGDKVLITADIDPAKIGVWTASSGAWTKVHAYDGMYFTVSYGGQNKDTVWVMHEGILVQARTWTDGLWADIKGARPALRLSVNTRTDTLLPPYVSAQSAWASVALTTALVSNPSARYTFGQNSPVEMVWKDSINYNYARVRALIRFDPMMWLGFTWGFNWTDTNGILYDGYDTSIPGVKRFRLHGENVPLLPARPPLVVTGSGDAISLVYTAYTSGRKQGFTAYAANGEAIGYFNEGDAVSIGGWSFQVDDEGRAFRIGDRFEISAEGVQFHPTTVQLFNGFGQVFTNALRATSVDTNDSYAISAYRDWDVHMGYRAGGMVATDDLHIKTESDTLSNAAYQLVFKRNPNAASSWLQALRITVEKFGGSYIDDASGVHKPSGDASDWVFKIDGYNPRDTRLKVFEMDANAETMTFRALNGEATDLVWTQPTQRLTDTVSTVQLPITISGVQNVVNFLFGYANRLDADGWTFNDGENNLTDAATGRSRNMQLEIEKFVNAVFVGMTDEQGHIVNPFLDAAWYGSPTGLPAEFVDTPLFDVQAHPGVFDVLGVKYSKDDLNVIRRNDKTRIGAVGPMYSAHVLLDEYEHLFIFGYWSQSSTQTGLLYDPFSGSRVRTYKFNGRIQQVRNMRPEFGGHYLVGNEARMNLQASTDNVQHYYNANHVYENTKTTRQAMALLGFSEKQYFTDLDVSPASQFNFWRGLIQYKGTNMSVDAFLNNIRYDDAKLDEFWAYKVAEYGDSRQKEFPEMRLKVSDVLTQFAQYQFDAPIVCDANGENCKAEPQPGFINVDSADEDRWFTIDDLNNDSKFLSESVGTYRGYHAVGDVIDLPFIADGLRFPADTTAQAINTTTIRVTSVPDSGLFIVHGFGYARPRFNPVKLYNYQLNELIREIPIWHPATGVYTAMAMEGVNLVTGINPAKFNYSTLLDSNAAYDPLRIWGNNEVGRVWLDTSTLNYIPYWDTTIFPTYGERLSRWGMLADYGSVNVYEWVKSTVPPAEYNALAKEQAGNADLDPATKAAGEVGFATYYRRDRNWSIKPVAWSYSPVPLDVDWGNKPPFASASNTAGLLFANGLAILDGRTFDSLDIEAGMHIGGWFNDEVNPYPVSEYLVEDRFTKFVCNENGDLIANQGFATADQGLGALVSIRANDENYRSDIAGNVIFTKPQIEAYPTMTDENGNVVSYNISVPLKATIVGSGETEQITITDAMGTSNIGPVYGATIDVADDQKWVFEIPRLGLTVTVQATTSGQFPADSLRNVIVNALSSVVHLRDAAVVSPIVPAQTENASMTNSDDYANTDKFGWRAWSIPTQAQLNADGQWPVSSWKPYVGEPVRIAGSLAQIKAAIEYSENPWILNNGTQIQRYESVWTGWAALTDNIQHQTQLDSDATPIEFVYPENLPVNRTSVYINGALQLKAAYTIVGKSVTIHSVKPGAVATVVVRKYDPTTADLAADAETDLTRQIEYKLDYEYVEVPVRGEDGGIIGNEYYFWVKNKSTPAAGKRMSIQNITQELVDGPDSYLTFQHYQDNGKSEPFYDAITISGLTAVVTKDDTFKLRFTRDFTLRDDPRELDLKNTHTEWTLIRPAQNTKIPETLWDKLTDSVSGADVAGNPIPSLRRTLYDERNGSRTQFGFGQEQTLAPADLLKVTLTHSIVNTDLVLTGNITVPDYIEGLDYDNPEEWFADTASSRNTMTIIWNNGSPAQVNEIFFKVLDDILASNYELTDLFKTSRLSAHSIKVVRPSYVQQQS